MCHFYVFGIYVVYWLVERSVGFFWFCFFPFFIELGIDLA